ncbi:hypothetical protein [Myxococcus sp. AM010]|uniref:hypothetical protein n=1 Tax=Myxococcus sp. AM010 TaxID=2745138 RepID=UPI0020D010D5|nr:hypothetical protein [Myxococcus sp. AM010]
MEADVFDAALGASRGAMEPPTALEARTDVQFTVNQGQPVQLGPWLPRDTDGSLDGYDTRLADALGTRRYALIISLLHAPGFGLWSRERAFFSELWRRVGLPLSGGITTLFHGNYEHSPVGVHLDRFSPEEREQLARYDVPYFFRKADGGPLLMMDAPPTSTAFRPVGEQQFLESTPPPAPHILSGEQLGLMNLGVALRDAVDAVAQDVRHRVQEAPQWGVRLSLEKDGRTGAVSFDWPETGKRLTFSWNRRAVRLTDEALDAPPAPQRGKRARREPPTA